MGRSLRYGGTQRLEDARSTECAVWVMHNCSTCYRELIILCFRPYRRIFPSYSPPAFDNQKLLFCTISLRKWKIYTLKKDIPFFAFLFQSLALILQLTSRRRGVSPCKVLRRGFLQESAAGIPVRLVWRVRRSRMLGVSLCKLVLRGCRWGLCGGDAAPPTAGLLVI